MGQISGKMGMVGIGGDIGGIKSWTIDYVSDVLDTTDFADVGVKSFIAGITSWSGSFEGFKDGAPKGIGSLIALTLEESTDSTQKYTGSAIVTGAHGTVSADGIVGISYDFQGSGALVVPTS